MTVGVLREHQRQRHYRLEDKCKIFLLRMKAVDSMEHLVPWLAHQHSEKSYHHPITFSDTQWDFHFFSSLGVVTPSGSLDLGQNWLAFYLSHAQPSPDVMVTYFQLNPNSRNKILWNWNKKTNLSLMKTYLNISLAKCWTVWWGVNVTSF